MDEVLLTFGFVVLVTVGAAWYMTVARLARIARALERLAELEEERRS